VDRYLARAAAAPVLEALEPAALAVACAWPKAKEVGADAARCPHCCGPPQVSFMPASGEALVSAPRRLVCARCAGSWTHIRMVCPSCGEATGKRLPVYSDGERFPHLRVEGCETCRRYLVTVDARRDAAAVPEVDELAALPLDLYAKERGLRKVTPNLMGM
jgi:FdhE protein